VKISNETKVGILATFAIILVVFGISFMRGTNIFSRNVSYYAKFRDVGGLAASNAVMLYGVKIGQVDELHFLKISAQDTMIIHRLDTALRSVSQMAMVQEDKHKKDSLNTEINRLQNAIDKIKQRVEVKFHVYGNVQFPENSIVKIKSDLLGSKTLEIVPGNAQAYAKKNDTLKGAVELTLPEELTRTVAPIKNKVEALVTSIDTVVTSLNEIFNDKTKRDLRNAFASIGPTIKNIESTTLSISTFLSSEQGRFHSILLNIDKIGQNIQSYNTSITRTIENIAAMTDTVRAMNFKKTISDINASITNVNDLLQKIKSGQGTIGKLVTDDKLYYDLVSATRSFDKMMYDLKTNPNKYFAPLGKKPVKPAPYKPDTAR
jgi:phospholipid/cholesterol/gamma-HCH transport system substrate-binding protein